MGEGGRSDRTERLAIASTMIRRWLVRSVASAGRAFELFSSPINPRWLPGNDRFEEHSADLAAGRIPNTASNRQVVSPSAVARRRRFRSLRWADIPAAVRGDVVGLLTGRLPLTAGKANNFAAPSLYRPHGLQTTTRASRARTAPAAVERRESGRSESGARYEHIPGQSRLGNVFFSTADARRSGFRVEVGPNPDALPAPAVSANPLVVLGAALGGWLLWPHVRRMGAT